MYFPGIDLLNVRKHGGDYQGPAAQPNEPLEPDVAWYPPGNSPISGITSGREAVIARCRVIDVADLTVASTFHLG